MLTACLILLASCTFVTSLALLVVVARKLRHPVVNVYNSPAAPPVSTEQVFNIHYEQDHPADLAKSLARRLASLA